MMLTEIARSMTTEFQNEIKVRDFSETPGGRFQVNGPYSGEEFRKTVLVPQLRMAQSVGKRFTVLLDGVIAYPVSFLEEAFGGLVRNEGFSQADLNKIMSVKSNDPFYSRYEELANYYIKVAK